MPKYKRHKTKFPGVYYIDGTQVGTGKTEKIFYILWRNDEGKLIEEKAGRQFQHDMTASRAAALRAQRIQGALPSNKERRKSIVEEKAAQEGRYTFEKLWETYREQNVGKASLKDDKSRYTKYIHPDFGNKEPRQIVPLDLDRLKKQVAGSKDDRLKKGKKKAGGKRPASVARTLELVRRLSNFAEKKQLCRGLSFKIAMPRVNNTKTEDLTHEQMGALLKALDESLDKQAADMMRLALCTGMRKMEIFRLQWKDVNFTKGFITIREPKGGTDQIIPLSNVAGQILSRQSKTESPFIFPGRGGGMRVDAIKVFNKIKVAAGLPHDFRPMHGLRHVFASTLASSGQVDLYTLQRLLTHKSPQMTMRYAHLRDDVLKKAANLAGEIITISIMNDKRGKAD